MKAKITTRFILLSLPLLLLTGVLLLLSLILLFPKALSYLTKDEMALGEESTNNFQRKIEYQELSPNGDNLIVLYKMPFRPGMYNHYYDYLSGQLFLAVRETVSGRERYIFAAEHRSGNPHWLGNNHAYFTVYCGTACEGIQLVGIDGRKSELAVLSYVYNDDAEKYETYFTDWFGHQFVFDGLVDELKTEMISNNPYLVFKMKDDKGISFGEKRFLFTGRELKEE